jgi:hypothetical protein
MAMNYKSILKETKQLLIDEGWIKHSYHNDNGYCLAGALEKVSINYGLNDRDYSRLYDWVGEKVPKGGIIYKNASITIFNDNAGSKEEIINFLDKLIAEA